MNRNKNRGNNRQRGGGGRNRYQGGGGGGGNRPNEGQNLARQKHHATQMREKYNNMVRDAQINGDRVDVEYYLQHVDHYNRVLTNIAEIEAERFAHQREQQGNQSGGNEGGANGGGEAPVEGAEAPQADGQQASGGENQQRQHHQRPRREHRDDNGAREANSNTTDIPLPGSILPPI